MTLARTLAKTYDPRTVEPRLSERWQREGVYQFDRASDRPVYAIDTPPPPSLATCTWATPTRTAIPISSRASGA